MDDVHFDRLCRTTHSEAYLISHGPEVIGRVDLHFTADVVFGLLVVEQAVSQDDITSLVELVDDELASTAESPRDDFLVTVYQGAQVGIFSDSDSATAEEGNGSRGEG